MLLVEITINWVSWNRDLRAREREGAWEKSQSRIPLYMDNQTKRVVAVVVVVWCINSNSYCDHCPFAFN